MEVLPGDDCFRHVPVRLFERDRPLLQGLYRAAAASSSSSGEGDSKARRTLRDLLKEALPDKDPDKGKLLFGKKALSGGLVWVLTAAANKNFRKLCRCG